MTVESASYISQLDTTLPTASNLISEGDDHLRLTKTVLKTQFPNFGTTAIAASAVEVNYLVGVTGAIQPQINSKGAISGQAWTGAHSFAGATSVPTLAAGSNTTGAASTAFVQADFLQKFPNYTAPVNASTAELNYLVGLTGAIQPQLSNQVSGPIHAATSKTTPADADELGITDSAASWALKKLTFANLRAWLSGLFVGKTGPQVMAGNLNITKPDSTAARVQTENTLGTGVSGMGGINAYEVGSTTSTPVHIYSGGLIRAVVDPTSGNLTMAGGALGYGSASYGTAVQPTSLTTDVVINKPSGEITMFSGIPPGGDASFLVINNTVSYGDLVTVQLRSALSAYSIEAETAYGGSFRLRVRNVGGGTYGAVPINFAVIKVGAA